MVKQSPASALLEQCIAMHREGDDLTVATDARGHPGKVLIAIWRPAASFVMSIDASEYDGLALAKLCGFTDLVKPSVIERTRIMKAAHAKH